MVIKILTENLHYILKDTHHIFEIKRTNKFIRNARGTALLAKADEKIIKRNFLRS